MKGELQPLSLEVDGEDEEKEEGGEDGRPTTENRGGKTIHRLTSHFGAFAYQNGSFPLEPYFVGNLALWVDRHLSDLSLPPPPS